MNKPKIQGIGVGGTIDLPSSSEGAYLELFRKDAPPTLSVLFSNVAEVEVEAFSSKTPLKVGLYNPDDKTMIFIFKFGSVFSIDCPFNINRISKESQNFYKDDIISGDSRLFLTCVLADITANVNKGIVKGIRSVTFSPFFTRLIIAAAKKQSKYSIHEVEDAHNHAVMFYQVADLSRKIDFHKCGED